MRHCYWNAKVRASSNSIWNAYIRWHTLKRPRKTLIFVWSVPYLDYTPLCTTYNGLHLVRRGQVNWQYIQYRLFGGIDTFTFRIQMFVLNSKFTNLLDHIKRYSNEQSKFETLLLNARLLTSHKKIMIHMKLSTENYDLVLLASLNACMSLSSRV